MTQMGNGQDCTLEEVEQEGHQRWLLRWMETGAHGAPKACIATYSDREAAELVREFLCAGLMVALDGGELADLQAPVGTRRPRASVPHRARAGEVYPWRR
jgi:hypothetical protein